MRWPSFIGSRLLLACLCVAAPGIGALAVVLISGVPARLPAWLMLAAVIVLTVIAIASMRAYLDYSLRTLSNLIDALREGDYGVRGRVPSQDSSVGQLVQSFNTLAAQLQQERLSLHETLQLFSKTLASLDSAVFAFETDGRLRLVNPAGEALLARPATELLGQDWLALGLADCMNVTSGSTQAYTFPGRSGRWQITHASLRSRSQSGRLLVIQPIEQALRREEAHAFQRLLRVLSHEINNSMTPIISMADTLQRLSHSHTRNEALGADLDAGLQIISQRGAALQRFIGGYARLARLPVPKLSAVSLRDTVEHVFGLLEGLPLHVESSADARVWADPDQLEQVLINLLRNADEAGGDGVVVRWHLREERVRIEIADRGHGLPVSDNLFVPFFTTKPQGSGIGMVLARQIIEAMHGSVDLRNREDGPGAVAVIELPSASGR